MTIHEKIKKKDTKIIHLYKEGVFWIAYEYDAYSVSQVKSLKPTKKFVKAVQQEVVSVGFPNSALEKSIFPHYTVKEREDTRIVMESTKSIDTDVFETWKNQIQLLQPQKNVLTSALTIHSATAENTLNRVKSNSEKSLLNKLQSFKLYTASPMDCMRFIEELQDEFC